MNIGFELTHAGRTMLWRPVETGAMTAGRNPEADLCVPDDSVAPIQFVLRREGRAVTLCNRAADGTRVGDEVVSDELRLADGDVVTLGSIEARLRFIDDGDAESGRTRTLATGEPTAGLGLVVSAPELYPGRTWDLSRGQVTAGSDPSNDLVIDDEFVSGFHARFNVENGRCMVRDLGSRNGVFIGEQKVREAEVAAGAQVRLGKVVVLVRSGTAKSTPAPESRGGLVGRSNAMERVRELVRRVAGSDAVVLITGETGTGKEVVARMLADLSPRAGKAYVTLNCGSLSRNLIASELFGHEKGAFTGAVGRKAGAFEAAIGGTLFLDEIGELPLDLQPQLLRVLESQEVRRVGATESFHADVRLLAATNRRLQDSVRDGIFREDLFHRLHVLTIDLPPLRQRRDDIAELAAHFLHRFAPTDESLSISDAAINKLQEHDWPGNVRELRNVVQRAVLMRLGADLTPEDIIFTPSTLVSRVQTESATSGRTLNEIERDAIASELRRLGGSKKEAAAALGVSRSTIHRKITEYKIDVDALLRDA